MKKVLLAMGMAVALLVPFFKVMLDKIMEQQDEISEHKEMRGSNCDIISGQELQIKLLEQEIEMLLRERYRYRKLSADLLQKIGNIQRDLDGEILGTVDVNGVKCDI